MNGNNDLNSAGGVVIRAAELADFLAFRGEPPQYRVKAWVGTLGGTIIGMGGIYYPDNSPAPVAWAEYTDEARRYAKTLHKAALGFLRSSGHRQLVAVADRKIEASGRWLERLGFVYSGKATDEGDIYTWSR